MKQNIWILNHYASTDYQDRGGRHYYISKCLRDAGYMPVVFCAQTMHNTDEVADLQGQLYRQIDAPTGVPFVFVKCRTYAGNGKQRVLNMVDFYRNVKKAAKQYAAQHGKPDIIYASSVHPLTVVAGIQLAKYFGVPCIGEVRDLWPESIVEYSDRFDRDHPLMKILYRGEKWIYQKADSMIFTMEGAYDYITERGWDKAIPRDKVFHINNGVDLEMFDYNRDHYTVDDPDLDDMTTLKVVYTGSIRRVNNLGQLVDAAKLVKDPRIKFLIWGDGDELDDLRRRVQNEYIGNVVFKGRVEKRYIPSIISRSDLNVVHWEMSHILRYGESYNKLFEYLAAGKPIFSTVQAGYSVVEGNHCGADTAGFTPEDFAAGIERILHLPEEERKQLGENARRAAHDYDFKTLTDRLIQIIER